MELTETQYDRIAPYLPVQRGNVKVSHLQVLNAILYVTEHSCKWRELPERFGPWHTVYMRVNRWAKSGVLDRVFTALQEEQILQLRVEVIGLDSLIVPVNPDGTEAQNKTGSRPSVAPAASGPPKFIWLPRMSGRP